VRYRNRVCRIFDSTLTTRVRVYTSTAQTALWCGVAKHDQITTVRYDRAEGFGNMRAYPRIPDKKKPRVSGASNIRPSLVFIVAGSCRLAIAF